MKSLALTSICAGKVFSIYLLVTDTRKLGSPRLKNDKKSVKNKKIRQAFGPTL
jgi:hypothetical protein